MDHLIVFSYSREKECGKNELRSMFHQKSVFIQVDCLKILEIHLR